MDYSFEELEEMASQGLAPTDCPEGCIVEPDGLLLTKPLHVAITATVRALALDDIPRMSAKTIHISLDFIEWHFGS